MVWGDCGGVLCEAWSGVTVEVCYVKHGLGVCGGVLCEAWSGVTVEVCYVKHGLG